MQHTRFNITSIEDLASKAAELSVYLPISQDLTVLGRSLVIGSRLAPNRFAIQPMEGCDGTSSGQPGHLTVRRYERFYGGGAGLIWFEATAVTEEGRANPRQLYITEANHGAFRALREDALALGKQVNGTGYQPYTVLQLTHSGRYSRPNDQPAPVIAHHDGILDGIFHLPSDYQLITDEELQALVIKYVAAARLAQSCGFDAIDIKSCHRYLLNELLAAHTRPGNYGGSFENRTRLLLEIINAVRTSCPELAIWVRLNVFDGHPYPWGWGVSQQNPLVPDLGEPLRLIGMLEQAGVAGINVTAGNPYLTPFINRPYDRVALGGLLPDENPLYGVGRLLSLAREVKQTYPGLVVVGSGFSWLRQYLPDIAAGAIEQGWMDMTGIGREAFAYPSLPRDVLENGELNPNQVCITCSRCTQIMRDHGCTGCAVFDREVYGPIYETGMAKHKG